MPEAPRKEMTMSWAELQEKNMKALAFIEEVTTNADEVQRRVLSEILSLNSGVEYLSRHNLNGRTDRASFKNTLPVIKYEDIAPEINRIANGDSSPILSSRPISEFLTRYHLYVNNEKSTAYNNKVYYID